MNLGLTDRAALVLGSTSGLGRAVAEALSIEGARVAVHGRDTTRARQVVSNLPGAIAVIGDLTAPGGGEYVVAEAAKQLGGLDVLVVNTGGAAAGGIMDGDATRDREGFEAMLRPALEAVRAAAPHLRSSDQGRAIFLTARSVIEATPDLALSSVFRSGVAAAARSLAIELGADGVLVNVVVTGQFDTPALQRFESWVANRDGRELPAVRADHLAAIPLRRLGEPEELADVVAFLCSARASFVTGSTIAVDGGATRGF